MNANQNQFHLLIVNYSYNNDGMQIKSNIIGNGNWNYEHFLLFLYNNRM